MIFAFVKPADLQKWIATNAAGSLKSTAGDSWRAYLVAQGATGSSLGELERSFLSSTGSGSLYDRWQAWLAANGGTGNNPGDKFRKKFS